MMPTAEAPTWAGSLTKPQVAAGRKAAGRESRSPFGVVDGTWAEEQHPADAAVAGQVQVPEHDGVDRPEPTPKRPVEAQEHRAAHDERRGGGGQLDPSPPAPVGQPDARSGHVDDSATRKQDAGGAIVVSLHRRDLGNLTEPVEYGQLGDVARVQDHVDAGQRMEHRSWKLRHPFAHMGVGHHADAYDLLHSVTTRSRGTPHRRTERAR